MSETYYKAVRADGGLGKLGQDGYNVGVICCFCATFPHVAWAARQDEVVQGGSTSGRDGHQVVKMEDAPIGVEELQDAPLIDRSTRRPQSAMLADAAVSFGDAIAYIVRNVLGHFGVQFPHATMIARIFATSPVCHAPLAGGDRR